MNVKHASVFAGSVAAIALAGVATAGFNGMAFEAVDNEGNGAGGDTYRIYAMMDMGDRLDAVAGNSEQNLSLTTTGTFYQNASGGATSLAINSAFFDFVPSLEWDSYVTIGALYSNGEPFDSNNMNDVGMDWSNFETGGDLEANNGTWFVTPDQAQGEAIAHAGLGGDYGVLIAQVTVMDGGEIAGTFSGLLQGKTAAGDTWQEGVNGFEYGAVPAPGALALLGLAGLAGRRRRH